MLRGDFLLCSCRFRSAIYRCQILLILLHGFGGVDAAMVVNWWAILDRIVHGARFWIILVPLHLVHLPLQLRRLLHLLFQPGGALSQLAWQVFDLSVLVLLNQAQFVLRCLHLPLKFRLGLLPLRGLRLKVLYFVLQVVHVNLHLMLKLSPKIRINNSQ